jgi:S1-C subfamily serine protease
MGAWLGISGQDLSPRMAAAMDLPSSDGVLVTGVEPGSPADSARVLPEDVITDLDAERIRYFGQLMTKVSSLPPNSTVTLGFSRQGRRLEARVRLGQRSVALPPQPTLGAPVTTSVLGLVLEAVDPSTSELTGLPPYGALVKEVTPGSAAARAEVVLGTVIVEVDRKPVRSPEDVRRELGALSGAAPVLLKVQVRGSRNQASYHLLEPR